MPRAGLDPATVTRAGAELADEIGFDALSMRALAERLGVRTPSLYKHVDGLADLTHRIAVLAADELADLLATATAGPAGRRALVAATTTMRGYVRDHPGRYAATTAERTGGPADPLATATTRLLGVLTAVLDGYGLPPDQEVHALRLLRSTLHGFSTLEVVGGFQIAVDVDASFAWAVDLLDRGLRAAAGPPAAPAVPAPTPDGDG